MALTAAVDINATPPKLTVTSNRRRVSGTVTSAGDTANYVALFPVTITDDSGRVWTNVSDDGTTAVYTG